VLSVETNLFSIIRRNWFVSPATIKVRIQRQSG